MGRILFGVIEELEVIELLDNLGGKDFLVKGFIYRFEEVILSFFFLFENFIVCIEKVNLNVVMV